MIEQRENVLLNARCFILFSILVFIVSCSLADTAPYFVRLGEAGENRVKTKRGFGEYYFSYSYFRFTSKDNSEEQKEYFKFVKQEILNQNICKGNFSIFEETLSYYSEGGSVSVLVKCD